MAKTNNPYQPPADIGASVGWWERLRQFFMVRDPNNPLYQIPDFAAGQAVIYYGISFFIDPEDSSVLFAASPSADHSQERFDQIVAEALRLLPFFMDEVPAAMDLVQGRKLLVRMIGNYSDSQAEFIREAEVDAATFQAAISRSLMSQSKELTTE